MKTQTGQQLAAKKCVPCEGGVEPYTVQQAQAQLATLGDWQLVDSGRKIRKQWQVKDFMSGLGFFEKVAVVAEQEGHHPDLHLEGYRNLSIEIWTHAVGGLSENDFILAAKIDRLPIALGP